MYRYAEVAKTRRQREEKMLVTESAKAAKKALAEEWSKFLAEGVHQVPPLLPKDPFLKVRLHKPESSLPIAWKRPVLLAVRSVQLVSRLGAIAPVCPSLTPRHNP